MTMDIHSSSPLTPEVLEFATVAVPFCSLLQDIKDSDKKSVIERLLKILPLLYVKGSLLPTNGEATEEDDEDIFLSEAVSEGEYAVIQHALEDFFGSDDLFLEVMSEDMQYSDIPLTAHISEFLADIYQPVGNLVALLRDENYTALPLAIAHTRTLFAEYWGDRLLAVLRALHKIAFAAKVDEEQELEGLMTEADFEAHIDHLFD